MMKKRIDISLYSADDVKRFADLAQSMDGKVTLSSGRYCIDAKSVIGIFVLDLASPLSLEIERWKEEYAEALMPFLYKL